jgi:D-methionine transport system permease protein
MHEFAINALLKATGQTIYMVFISSFVSITLGLILGCFLFLTKKNQALQSTLIYRVLSLIVDITRSVPFIILMISIIPVTRFIVGTTIGTEAAIIPLTVAALSFYARVCESALLTVPHGLIEVSQAMGASIYQTVTKVLIPESAPALIRGGTLTIIALISYSAMAGVVGGGGLGELAVNYGYQRFNLLVMMETTAILIVLVQLIQMIGDKLAQKPKLKALIAASCIMWIACIASQVTIPTSTFKQIRVGVMSGWSEEVMKVAQRVAYQKYHMSIKIVTFSDYVQPNNALDNHSIDVNIFQHAPYLESQITQHHYAIKAIAKTFVYPMGFYSKKIKNIAELNSNAIVAIPNDPSNGARALLLLQKYGLIKLKANVSALATIQDITKNPKKLRIKELDAAQLPRVLHDVDIAAITNDFITATNLTINDAVLKEGADSLYANLIVTQSDNKDNEAMQEFVDVMHSKPVLEKTEQLFPNGAAIPAW